MAAFPLLISCGRLHLVPALGPVRLVKLRSVDVERMLRQKLDAGLSPRRVQYIHAVLRRGLGRAVRWGWVAQNAASLAEIPRVPPREVEPLTPAKRGRCCGCSAVSAWRRCT